MQTPCQDISGILDNSPQPSALVLPVSMIIDTPQAYAIAAGSFFVALLFARTRNHLKACVEFARRLALRHLAYPQLIRRRRFIGPWSRAGVFVQLLFFAANAFCISFRAMSIRDAGRRAAHLSLINLISAYGGPHLSFLADVFGVSLGTFRLIHRSAGAMSLLLLVFHVGVSTAIRTPFPLRVAENMWGLIVRLCRPSHCSGSMCGRSLMVSRVRARFASSSSCLFPPSAGRRTRCFFDCTKHWQFSLSFRPGIT